MPTTFKISPVTRIEGHLDVEVTVDQVAGALQVVDAKASGVMFRGFENILAGRDPRDAVHYTQRVCGVCPVSHGMASSLALEQALGVTPTDNGRIVRNLVLGANYIQSHILHFYHLAAPDYVDTQGILDMSPWKPRYHAPDMASGAAAAGLVQSYVKALEMRRKAHVMAAVYAGRIPMVTNFVPGGSSEIVHEGNIAQFRSYLDELKLFIEATYLPDVEAVAGLFPAFLEIGRGCGNFLAYGVFDLDAAGTTKLLKRGRYTAGADAAVDPGLIKEYVGSSWFTPASGNKNPAEGVTEATPRGGNGYSWVKAPRYEDVVHEVGPLARMWVNGDYRRGVSVIDRIAARAHETKKVADAMATWLDQLVPDAPVYAHAATPAAASGMGLTEAPRGALGHWLQIENKKLARYQIITPTAWNASPRDDAGNLGALEQALIGTPVRSMSEPVEVVRVIHSVDPCLACAVHVARPGEAVRACFIPAGLVPRAQG